MNALNTAAVTEVARQVHPDMHSHPTTVAYIQTLLKQYAEVIEPADLGGITQWIPAAFPGKLGERVLAEMNKAKGNMINELDAAFLAAKGVEPLDEEKHDDTSPEVIAAAKIGIIEYLVAELFELGGDRAREQYEYTILPWDVQRGIANNEEMSKIFGITKETKQLPVEVVIGAQKFTHQLTLELTIGLVLFSDASVGKRDFKIAMFGVPFTSEYIVPPPQTGQEPENKHVYRLEDARFGFDAERNQQPYSVVVGKETYGFTSPDFMQGIATGAQWAGVDHHQYWKELMQHTYTADGENALALKF